MESWPMFPWPGFLELVSWSCLGGGISRLGLGGIR